MKAAFECGKTSITCKSCFNNNSEEHLLVGLCLAQLLSAVLNNAHVIHRHTSTNVFHFKFRCCFAASCLHIANVICDSFLCILQLVVEFKCMTRFLPLFLTCLFSFERCCMRPHFLQIGSFFNPGEQKFIYSPSFFKKALCVLKTKADQIWIFSNLCWW